MNEPHFIIALIITFLAGACMMCGLVVLYLFLGSQGTSCQATLYGMISSIL